MAIGLNSAFKLSGSSVRPAYPGFIVMNAAQLGTSLISRPSNMNREAWKGRFSKQDKGYSLERNCELRRWESENTEVNYQPQGQ